MLRRKRWLLSIVFVLLLAAGASLRRLNTPQLPTRAQTDALRTHTPSGMVAVPGSDCLLGTDDADADEDVKPMRRVFVASYYIDVHEVTNAEYHRFDPTHGFSPGLESLPATNILAAQAEAYAKWAGKRLPTEAEWEKAARGTDGRRYPWGNEWNPKLVAQRAHRGKETAVAPPHSPNGKVCFIGPARTQPVGSVPASVSPYGCVDMAGNAWEWVQGNYNGNPDQRILRGGAVGYGERSCRTYHRALEGTADT